MANNHTFKTGTGIKSACSACAASLVMFAAMGNAQAQAQAQESPVADTGASVKNAACGVANSGGAQMLSQFAGNIGGALIKMGSKACALAQAQPACIAAAPLKADMQEYPAGPGGLVGKAAKLAKAAMASNIPASLPASALSSAPNAAPASLPSQEAVAQGIKNSAETVATGVKSAGAAVDSMLSGFGDKLKKMRDERSAAETSGQEPATPTHGDMSP
jgi:hypothetical protein